MSQFSKNRFQKLAGLLKEDTTTQVAINEEVDFPEDYSELKTWLDQRPGISKKVTDLIEADGEDKAAEWLFANFDQDLQLWSGNELVEFLSKYSTNLNDDYDEDDYYDDSMDGDFDSGMASAGFGTDEDYGSLGGDDW